MSSIVVPTVYQHCMQCIVSWSGLGLLEEFIQHQMVWEFIPVQYMHTYMCVNMYGTLQKLKNEIIVMYVNLYKPADYITKYKINRYSICSYLITNGYII